jgi:predicted dehydrogenase
VNAVYLQSHLGGDQAYSWRCDKTIAGFGALGDLGVHMIDGVRFLTGLDYAAVVGVAQVLIPRRPDARGVLREVTTDTNAAFLGKMANGAIAVFETTQVAPGYGNHFRIEISGTKGTVTVLSERGEEIAWHGGGLIGRTTTWRTAVPWMAVPSEFAANRVPKTPSALVAAIHGERIDYPDFADGLAAQRVLDAVGLSAQSAKWETIG